MPKRLLPAQPVRNVVSNEGVFQEGDGDMMMKRTIKNYGPDDEEVPKKVKIQNTGIFTAYIYSYKFLISFYNHDFSNQNDNLALLKKMFDAETKRIYGKKYKERIQEPSMNEILSGGLEKPVENDYTKPFDKRGDKKQAQKNIEEEELKDVELPPYK